ncbi:MAG: hypothetical protein LBL32_00955 [Holosporales bacterium]|jgi:hypothetical protein|nr:hypothetical protein [Holosporales bacterium]
MNEGETKVKDNDIAHRDHSSKKRRFLRPYWVYILSACIAGGCSFAVLKIWIGQYERDAQATAERCEAIENKIKAVAGSVTEIFDKIDAIIIELKSNKENSSYIYTSIASLQKDVECIKNEINIRINHDDDTVRALSPEKKEFIESFENLVKDGAPFVTFIAAHSEKIDIKKYATSNEVMKFSEMTVKSSQSLRKAFASISVSVFDTIVEESFWEKQKRVIKEKIFAAFKVLKKDNGDESVRIPPDADDKSLFTMANEAAKEGNFEKSFEILEKIDTNNQELSDLILDVKKRADLEKSFQKFKTEFIEIESKNTSGLSK